MTGNDALKGSALKTALLANLRPGSPLFKAGARGAVVTTSYVATSLVVLVAIALLRGRIPADLLQRLLGFYFVVTLSAALEPATTKSLLVRGRLDGRDDVPGLFPYPLTPVASASKSLLACIPLGFVWLAIDKHLSGEAWVLASLPVTCLISFATTDLRVGFDAEGRHSAAIWAKQGSLSLAMAGLALALGGGGSFGAGVALSLALRMGWLVLFGTLARHQYYASAFNWPDLRRHMLDGQWMHLAAASVLSATSGSLDRFVALRSLTPTIANSYYLTGEVLTKFWLIPYVFCPILFARRAASADADRLYKAAIGLTAIFGTGFLLVVAGAYLFTSGLVSKILGADPGWGVVVFAISIVLASFTQLILADRQGRGEARYVLRVLISGVAVSVVAFYGLSGYLAETGIFLAWLIKSIFEFAMAVRKRKSHALG